MSVVMQTNFQSQGSIFCRFLRHRAFSLCFILLVEICIFDMNTVYFVYSDKCFDVHLFIVIENLYTVSKDDNDKFELSTICHCGVPWLS